MRAFARFAALGCLIGATSAAEAQDLLAAMRSAPIDWRTWEAGFTRPTRDQLLALRFCDREVGDSGQAFHPIDADGDGRQDLLYSGNFMSTCERAEEATRTMIYLSTDKGLRRVFAAPGTISRIWRAAPWRPINFVLTDEDGVSTEYSHAMYTPRHTSEGWTFELESYVVTDTRTQLPTRTMARPIPFIVTQDRYNLRATPVVDDSSADAFGQRNGNVMATFANGSRGMALAQQTDSTRTWWLVVMQSERIGAPATPILPLIRYMGWMSSRFLVRDTVRMKGPVDTLPLARP